MSTPRPDSWCLLSALASFKKEVGPLTVNHLGQLPAVTISFNLKPGVALGDAIKQSNSAAAQMLPSTISTSLQGTAQAFNRRSPGWACC